jgi:hypothetical protein
MKVTMLLADAAQRVHGKLYILGGGWSVTAPNPGQMAIAMKVEVPWDQADQEHQVRLDLVDGDGRPVPNETHPTELGTAFQVNRPPDAIPGSPMDATFAFTVHPLPPLGPGRYVWRLSIDGERDEDWQLAFTVRATP